MKFNRTYLAFSHDLIMAALSLLIAFYLRVGSDIYYKQVFWPVLAYSIPLYAITAAITFRAVGMYKGIWRYASIPDLVAIGKGVTISLGLFIILLFITTRLENFPRSVPVIQWFLLICMLGGPRFLYRSWRDQRLKLYKKSETPKTIPVALIGAGDGAELFVRATHNSHNHDYEVIAILDEKGGKEGRSMFGIPVLGLQPDDLKTTLNQIADKTGKQVQKLIFTNSQGEDDRAGLLRKIDYQSEALGVSLARLPSLTAFKEALVGGEVSVQAIALEDLLGRAQTPLDYAAIEQFVTGRTILVTGAGGTIGSEITRQLASLKPSKLILIDHSEYNLYQIDQEVGTSFPDLDYEVQLANVRDRDRIFRLFEQFKPELVFHAAALKHVPMVELNPEEGVLTNLIGTRNVADAAYQTGTLAMVQISTDKAVNPTNVMGASKRLGELYAQSLDLKGSDQEQSTRFLTVRFGNVLGSSGSVIPLFQKQLAAGGPLTVTHPDIKRYFMTVREAVGLVLQASAKGHAGSERGQIFVLDMGEPIRIQDIAKKMIRLAGQRPGEDVHIAFTGLRPGEKLYEELFDASEKPLKTNIDGVLGARPQAIDLSILQKNLAAIELSADQADRDKLYQLLEQIVKGYRYDPSLWQAVNKNLNSQNEETAQNA